MCVGISNIKLHETMSAYTLGGWRYESRHQRPSLRGICTRNRIMPKSPPELILRGRDTCLSEQTLKRDKRGETDGRDDNVMHPLPRGVFDVLKWKSLKLLFEELRK